MVTLVQSLVMLLLVGVFAYRREKMSHAMLMAAAALVVMTVIMGFSILPWLIFAVVAALYLANDLRMDFVTRKVYDFFRKVLPPMTETEKVALEAGDVWWEADLFRGNPDWDKLHAFPKPELTAEEQSFLDNETETLCRMLDDWEIVNQRKDLPKEVWDYMKEQGFFGLIISKQYGGKEFSALAHSTIVTKIASRSGSAAVTVMVPNSLGPAELLMHYGTTEQKDRYLPTLATGEEIPCFALTAPKAGSDAGAIPDTGVVCMGEHEGEQVLGIRLNFDKRYITLAPVATVVGLAFKLQDPDGLLGDNTTRDYGITCALIPADHPGMEIGNRHIPMSMAFMNGPVRGEDVFIPVDWIIGGREYAGQGWRMLMESLAAGRSISLPAIGAATGKVSYRMTGAYARIREQFKTPIGYFQGVEEAMSRIAGYAYQLEACRVMTASAVDLGVKPSVVSAIAKYHMTEMGRQTATDAMDVHGGRGLILGERNYLAYGYMNQPIGITVEGANILTRNLIIFGQGAIRCHPYIFREMQAATNDDFETGLKKFDSLLFRHIGYSLSNFARAFALGLTGARIKRVPVDGPTAVYYRQLSRMSAALAFTSDIAMLILGGELKRKERLSARLGDALSHLYLSSSVLKFYRDSGCREADLPYVDWNLQTSLFEIQKALLEFCENFSNRFVGKFLKRMIFPFGPSYELPSDRLEHKLVAAMMEESELRDRITRYTYINRDPQDATGRVENAFSLVLATVGTRKIIRKAVKAGDIDRSLSPEQRARKAVELELIDNGAATAFIEAEAARLDAIQVDDYTPEAVKNASGEIDNPDQQAA